MHLFYVDESGSVTDPAQKHFVLAGVAVFERKTHWIEQKLNEVEKKKNNPKHETPHSIVDRYLASLIKNLIPCLSDQV